MRESGWTVLEADATSLLADQSRIGELEGRLRRLLENLDRRRRVLWYAPAFHELLVAGRHSQNPNTGVLDVVLPAIEQGRIVVIGEARSLAYERLVAARPQLGSALEVVRLDPEDEAGTLALGEAWAAAHAPPGEPPIADGALLREALQLAGHLLSEISPPGNLLTLLELTRRHRQSHDLPPRIALEDLLDTLSALSGLPRSVLDDRRPLDLSSVRERFERAVVGQRDAVECLVERIAMIKAGLTDPERPLGVFLLVGPTGTGKTELAKALARFLFGSTDRMVRLDMSEFQDADSLGRLLGEATELAGPVSLASAVRRQPFSVVLLDEFEKAHRNVWDIFLQVFDDGRLTDRLGNTANFRHTIILLTSNLGAAIGGSPIGFVGEGRSFSPSAVHKAVADTFRPEFLNRLDRIIVFEPLSRAVMREILRKELEASLQPRGLRTREWAVEWEESVVEFLLEKGFTAELGARPLRRAIERHVLGPLSATIVEHRFPAGDQFLFLRSDGAAVQAEFVDPDAPEEQETHAPEETSGEPAADGPTLGGIALAARGVPEELALLESIYGGLRAKVESASWTARKEAAMRATREPDFWERDERTGVLDEIELMDRIEAALATAGSIARRLKGGARAPRARYPASMLSRLAGQIHVVDAACRALDAARPQDAVVTVEAFADPQLPKGANEAFARRLADMYRAWARRRRMRLHELDAATLGEPVVAAFAVTGLGAFTLLEAEAGLHVWEEPDDPHRTSRVRSRVRVLAKTDAGSKRAGATEAALTASLAASGDAVHRAPLPGSALPPRPRPRPRLAHRPARPGARW
jgi:ATP-dependent Clp protease ATP-binding subunit ClpC